MKKLVVISLFFLNFNGFSQIEKVGDKVCMSVTDYTKVRIKIIECDALKTDCDSAVIELNEGLRIKDSVIVGMQNKIALKDSIIAQKDITIKAISEVKNPGKFKAMDPKFLLGVISGILAVLIIGG